MILSWNVRGLNKKARHLEISAHLKNLLVPCVALLETRVKSSNAGKIRKVFGAHWCWIDNYTYHVNGRIWIMWKPNCVDIRLVSASDQHIHCGVYDMNGDFSHWLTIVYAHNHLEQRRGLWNLLKGNAGNLQGMWMIIGDFNNVLTVKDRVGGNPIHAIEFVDLETMMEEVDLHEHESSGPYFTWFNKHHENPIYSQIDRMLCNRDWFLRYADCRVEVLDSHISDHAPIRVILQGQIPGIGRQKPAFKFLNCIVGKPEVINAQWSVVNSGTPMYQLWRKLKHLQPFLRRIMHQATVGVRQIQNTRDKLALAQQQLASDLFNGDLIKEV